MKLYDGGRAPNPRRVRVFLAEKGITVPMEPVDMGAMQHKTEAYTAINPLQRLPALELDDGTILTETMAICRYFEALQPQPRLFGAEPKEMALIEMWQRRVELHLMFAIQQVFRHLHPAMAELEKPQVPAWGEANKPRVQSFLEILERELGTRRFVAADTFSVADITAMVAIDFMKPAKLPLPEGMPSIMRWHAEVSARPSAKA
jgi:glutathione S-transferase